MSHTATLRRRKLRDKRTPIPEKTLAWGRYGQSPLQATGEGYAPRSDPAHPTPRPKNLFTAIHQGWLIAKCLADVMWVAGTAGISQHLIWHNKNINGGDDAFRAMQSDKPHFQPFANSIASSSPTDGSFWLSRYLRQPLHMQCQPLQIQTKVSDDWGRTVD